MQRHDPETAVILVQLQYDFLHQQIIDVAAEIRAARIVPVALPGHFENGLGPAFVPVGRRKVNDDMLAVRPQFVEQPPDGLFKRKRSADGVGLEVPWHQGFDVGGRPALSDAA